ncbi:hypothetical protein ACFYRC_33795 [Streptomyces sp. NPDC005279]|uniref:hypothetical protein n=1 Tax=Streptomyces sp. NPDC005279 TaxID=3364712 RepID=UPI003677BAB2
MTAVAAVMSSWRSVVADSGHPDGIGRRVLAEFQRRLPVATPPLAGPALVGLGQECATVMRRIDRYTEEQSVSR